MREFLLPVFLCLAIFFLLGKLFSLQVVQGSYYRNLSNANRFRTMIIHAPRGVIFDRDGNPLVFNIPGFRESQNGKTKVLSQAEAIGLLAKNDPHLEVDSLRQYPKKDITAHVLGYIGEVTANDLQTPEFSTYRVGDFVGKMGIEEYYEDTLRGTDGQKLTEVDAMGKVIRVMGQTDPVPGKNITLTLDASLQEKVYEAMRGVSRGAAIVTNPKGEVLAMVSKPSFDPNLFTLGKTYKTDTSSDSSLAQILTDNQGQPLLNRAIAGTYPPGSTFKIVVAASALENNIIDQNFTVEDNGVLKIGNFSFANWYYTQYGRTEGQVNVVSAIKRSNDIFFYTVGEKVGVDRLSAFAKEYGLGQKLGIDVFGEAKGLLPTKEWKKKTIGEDWYTGDDYHYGIGQGYLLTTPLQVNSWTQAIANKGTLYTPHLLKALSVKRKGESLLSEKNFALIREGMVEACSPGGVAWPLFNFTFHMSNVKYPIDGKNFFVPTDATSSAHTQNEIGVSIACKTGTAQHGGDNTLPHAWITLFAPAYNPQIIVTILSEDSGEGSNVAGPIAKDILTAWFER